MHIFYQNNPGRVKKFFKLLRAGTIFLTTKYTKHAEGGLKPSGELRCWPEERAGGTEQARGLIP